MSTAIYVLSDPTRVPVTYKVGSHTGSLQKLKSRYITAIPDLMIHYFIVTPHAKAIEDAFKRQCLQNRLLNVNGNVCEWLDIPLEDIVMRVSTLTLQCQVQLVDGTAVIELGTEQAVKDLKKSPVTLPWDEITQLKHEVSAQKLRIREVPDIKHEIVQLKHEVAVQKAVAEEVANIKKELAEHIEVIKEVFESVDEERNYYAQKFVSTRMRYYKGTRVAVAEVNEALEEFARPKVKYGYHQHSRALRAAGLPAARDINSGSYYMDWELLPIDKGVMSYLRSLYTGQ